MAVRDEIANLEDLVLSCLLRNPKLVLSEPLDLSWFTRWKAVIHAMIKLSGQGIEPDLFTIADAVGEQTLVADLGFLLSSSLGSPSNYGHYLKSLRAKVVDLTVFEQLRGGMRAIADGNPSSEVLGKLVAESLRLFTQSADRQYSFTEKQMMKIMLEKLEEIYDGNANAIGIKTGISKLDNVLGSLHPSDLCIVGARPAVGKTAFGITVMLNAALAGARVGFISTEMAVDQIGYRVASQLAKIEGTKFRRAAFDDNEWSRITSAVVKTENMNFRICDKSFMRVSDVMLQARAWDLDGGLDLLIVDYLTRIKPDNSVGNQNLDVAEIVTQLKNLARDLKIPVVCLAQLNRQAATAREPRMSDLRDSGVIEQEADCILLLHRWEDDQGDGVVEKSSIIIDKNRHGECVTALVNFDGSTGRWWCDDSDEF